ncbi:hypothetical protein TNCV_4297011 [Trichonephila clavipes]|nr:hypothetical protein TNCV_4297011 [Trichonephila clavipes]
MPGTTKYPPSTHRFNAEIVEVGIGGVTNNRPFGDFAELNRTVTSDAVLCHGRGSRVVKVSDRGWPCHEFEPSTTKDPPCRVRAMGVASIDAQGDSCGQGREIVTDIVQSWVQIVMPLGRSVEGQMESITRSRRRHKMKRFV